MLFKKQKLKKSEDLPKKESLRFFKIHRNDLDSIDEVIRRMGANPSDIVSIIIDSKEAYEFKNFATYLVFYIYRS
jgi:DNA-directed RNA polymerase subunit H (RpoH/RPB5)